MKKISLIKQELEQIRIDNSGLLRPHDVLENAKNPESAIHSWFVWDDTEAAGKYRLWQARQLISICVEILPQADQKTQVYVSLTADRKSGEGYRSMNDVLTTKTLRDQLLDQATREFERWEQKYHTIQELVIVFEAMQKVKTKSKPQKTPTAQAEAVV